MVSLYRERMPNIGRKWWERRKNALLALWRRRRRRRRKPTHTHFIIVLIKMDVNGKVKNPRSAIWNEAVVDFTDRGNQQMLICVLHIFGCSDGVLMSSSSHHIVPMPPSLKFLLRCARCLCISIGIGSHQRHISSSYLKTYYKLDPFFLRYYLGLPCVRFRLISVMWLWDCVQCTNICVRVCVVYVCKIITYST